MLHLIGRSVWRGEDARGHGTAEEPPADTSGSSFVNAALMANTSPACAIRIAPGGLDFGSFPRVEYVFRQRQRRSSKVAFCPSSIRSG